MATCNTDINVTQPFIPPINIPGFGLSAAPIQIPFPSFQIPTAFVQDLLSLVNTLTIPLPSGTFKPNIDTFTKNVFDLISRVFAQLAPFLSLYSLFTAVLNLILCLINIVCSLMNPFKLIGAIINLFKNCLPQFLAIFPWFLLIMLIISILLLLLALIDYIIAKVLGIIAEIIRNLKIFAKGATFSDAESTLAAIRKIGDLLCLIQNIMAIFGAISAIMAIIQSLSLTSGGLVCSECCGEDICPPFIKNDNIKSKNAELKYTSRVNVDVSTLFTSLPPGFNSDLIKLPSIREERWQLYDVVMPEYPIVLIVTPSTDLSTGNTTDKFWPDGITFTAKTPKNKAAYTADLRVKLNPNDYNIVDSKGERYFRINDCIVITEPYIGLYDYEDTLQEDTNLLGTLSLEGGLVFEDDGKTPFKTNNKQATLNNFIHKSSVNASSAPNDQVTLKNIEYKIKPGYATLMGYQLITAGCIPEVAIEKAIVNSVLASEDIRAVFSKLPIVSNAGILPDVDGALNCVLSSLELFRTNVSIESAGLFQANVESCLNNLRNETLAAICGAIIAGVSQFKSEIKLSEDVQFTTRSINVNVILKDAGGANIGANIPDSCLPEVLSKLKAEVTLGKVSDFTYNGNSFDAELTSKSSGTGALNVNFNNKLFNKVIVGVGTKSSSIVENILNYTFIDAVVEPVVRRDNTDSQ